MVDVAVVGGGPAGAVCALELARTGADVLVIERARFPRRKTCGEYLNAGAVAMLDELGLGAAVRAAAAPLRALRLLPAGAPMVELPFPGSPLAISREIFDEILLQAALDAGASLVHARAEGLIFEADRVTGVVVRDEAGDRQSVPARFIVGADGAGSLVARKLGLEHAPRGTRRFAIGGHYRGFADLDGCIEMYVGGGAYFAINPLDADRANVMVVVPERSLGAWAGAVDDGVRGCAAHLGRGQRSFAGVERVGARAAAGPLQFDVRRVVSPGCLLIGDAAGALNPFTGQGVFLALCSARDAAAAIETTLVDRPKEAVAFTRYARVREADFRIRRRLATLTGLFVDMPVLARRAVDRLRRSPHLGETLLRTLSGVGVPREPALSTFARLLT